MLLRHYFMQYAISIFKMHTCGIAATMDARCDEAQTVGCTMEEPWGDDDRRFMEHALLVAERGRGRVSPNPMVGCVLVKPISCRGI